MTIGVVDSTVIVHLFRKNVPARTWFATQTEKLAVTSITWLEVMYGAPGKNGQEACEAWLDRFERLYLTPSDQVWAMERMRHYRLSRGVEINDCLIASVCHRLQIPLYTQNLKDMKKLLPATQVVNPY
jgi:predicted nucleic acid-binding protein